MPVFKYLRRLRDSYLLRRHRIPETPWLAHTRRIGLLRGLDDRARHRLRNLASLFLYHKAINGAGGLELTDAMRIDIAAQACIPILNLGLDYYADWHEVIVYPDTFVVTHREQDPAGVVRERPRQLSGEAWGRGPVILSWADIEAATAGSNVIVHEFAHKLDLLNGAANGMPPLHPGMDRKVWTTAFSEAYEELCRQYRQGLHTAIDPYATEGPGEFFAVASEVFFTRPDTLREHFPTVYAQLCLYYRQYPMDP